ncbi:hypothetical protein [Rhodococcus sp. NPDC055024]
MVFDTQNFAHPTPSSEILTAGSAFATSGGATGESARFLAAFVGSRVG